ncbi:methylated-DNA--[protein]-cysteine S-methyltransferase [Paenibacillus sedimenti]|uniref:methylated-DNA--[protein]-cysteine S-methyltransferase n=1 Tax=Paenibacillus sedimenti TaxID=2770274 RepID=A0A926KVR7_9BACL|nr:methylated-DNA--[protein]-cysteine S-methyltransferase [Paenibacillus sedimenti]MBD0383781.1 methylated-DNA--[protein]-cysteine S-methyltransferase [Paenibacillus sedimenti]
MQTRTQNPIYWTVVHVDIWDLLLAASDQGLCYLQFLNSSPAQYMEDEVWSDLLKWIRKYAPGHELVRDQDFLEPYIVQIKEYLSGQRPVFTLSLDLRGTPFQMTIWQALQSIPHGQTSSYSEIAHKLDKIKAVRAVGTAIGANPVLIVVPCHRVLGKNGSLTGYRGGLQNKESLLSLEGRRAAKSNEKVGQAAIK